MRELSIDAATDNLDVVLDFVNTALEEGGCPLKLQTKICVAVEELFVNIAHYAYKDEIGKATIRITVGGEVIIEFEDEGLPFNPLEKEDPDIKTSIRDREIGGMGIFMVKQIMDSVEYLRENDKNMLTIRKTVS